MPALLANAPERNSNNGLLVVGNAESDARVVANKLIGDELRLLGYNIINLWAWTPNEEFVDAFRANLDTGAVVIGSLDAHAYEDLKDLQKRQEGSSH